ncbi:TetR/AcrR family transcriptional regulator [Nonomuraea sp. NPDC050556]|uniref:TetR/AcrR family transcriptional regulator n=1 Tax=Nonomuraea sp. NPDC050556 TaxID=3364369 RepID=UPI003797EC42
MEQKRVPNRRGQGELLRAELVRVAGELLATLGSEEALSLRAVAREAKVAPQSVYLHFADKKSLVSAVLQERFAELLADLEETAAKTRAEPYGRLRAICLAYCDYALRHPAHYRILFGTSGMTGWELDELHGLRALALLREAVQDCMGGDAEYEAICLWASLHGLVSLRRDRPDFPWPPLPALLDTLLKPYR